MSFIVLDIIQIMLDIFRALKRLNGEVVFGSKIFVQQSKPVSMEQRSLAQKKALMKVQVNPNKTRTIPNYFI